MIITHTTKLHGAGPRNLGAHTRKTDPDLKSPELNFCMEWAHNKLTSTDPHTQGSRLHELYFTDSCTQSDILASFISMTKRMLTAAYSLAFIGFLRVSEFTIPSRSRFNPRTHPTKASISCKWKYYAFTIKASKTDQLHQGHKIYIYRSHEKFCPYSAMQKYIGHFPHSPAVGAQPLFTLKIAAHSPGTAS